MLGARAPRTLADGDLAVGLLLHARLQLKGGAGDKAACLATGLQVPVGRRGGAASAQCAARGCLSPPPPLAAAPLPLINPMGSSS